MIFFIQQNFLFSESPTFHLVREIYDICHGSEQERKGSGSKSGAENYEIFISELEKALELKVEYIVIEPNRLGDETQRWIQVGNCLHKTAVVTGLATVVSGDLIELFLINFAY